MKKPDLLPIAAFFAISLVLSACSGGDPPHPGATEAVAPPSGDQATGPAPRRGVQAMTTHVGLSPQALIQAEKFMCVCGCDMRLGECTCEKDPGSVTMKRHLQSLVDQGMTPSEVTAAMVEKYGQAVLP